MSVLPLGIRPSSLYPNVPNAGELVAATPLGRDQDGKNLVAYIVRTEEEAPSYKPPAGLANNNSKNSALADLPNTYTPPRPKPRNDTAAQFIKPDDLLNRLEQAKVDQLRARDEAIRHDATSLNDGNGNELLTSYVYSNGPNGKRYAVGVSAPLITQKEEQDAKTPDVLSEGLLLQGGTGNPNIRAAIAYRQSSYNDSADTRAGLLNRSV